MRDLERVQSVVDQGLAELGRIDVVCANAGIGSWAVAWEMTAEQWSDMIDINLTGVFNAARAALPSMVARGEGGSVILTARPPASSATPTPRTTPRPSTV